MENIYSDFIMIFILCISDSWAIMIDFTLKYFQV